MPACHLPMPLAGRCRLAVAQLALPLVTTAALLASPVRAEPYQPRSDAEVVETLPGAGPARSEERRLRQQLAANPDNAALAVGLARRYLETAREQGEPRLAGRALALLQRWQPLDNAPADVVLMSATIRQHLHQFDAAASMLDKLLQREPRHAQASLTLATIRRVQGRYDASDRACKALLGGTADFYAHACLAENLGLRGRIDDAGRIFGQLLAMPGMPAAARGWLLTSVAELETRAGRTQRAEAAWRAAIDAGADDYARLSYADFLIDGGRHREAAALLHEQPRSDAVLLRLAIAASSMSNLRSPEVAEWRARMQQAALRPQSGASHAREQAMFALLIDGDAARALQLARSNVKLQREPIDLLLLARAARAAGDAAAVDEARRIRTEMELHDARLDALL
ncbi:hypothetical protein [Piscinibacter sakaiensis]|uniref:tetratricopeptide repeat protein n=1 Tax=Piscinibacter sakaiensis TaxID=1547922 RepID=UPI003AAB928E